MILNTPENRLTDDTLAGDRLRNDFSQIKYESADEHIVGA